jgi:hypothetical protein
VNTVEAGGMPAGTGSSYYGLRAHEAILPRDTEATSEYETSVFRSAAAANSR